MQSSGKTCFLSGLEIPFGKVSKDHYFPKHLLPEKIYSLPENIVCACKILNNIKGDLPPCIWEEQKYKLTLRAIKVYNISNQNKKFLKMALENWNTYKINPCNYCIARKFEEYCVKSR
jgi:hypothetical protein